MERLEKTNDYVILSQNRVYESNLQPHQLRNIDEAQTSIKLPPPVVIPPKVKNNIKLQVK